MKFSISHLLTVALMLFNSMDVIALKITSNFMLKMEISSWVSNNENYRPAIGGWDVSELQDFSYAFYGKYSFNDDISMWNTSSATTMSSMFYNAQNFNQDISNWDISNVNSIDDMFNNAQSFNQNISNWDTSNINSMDAMFVKAHSFNQNISNWDTSKVTSMSSMFYDAQNFNQDISNWDTLMVTNMANMFSNAQNFNQDISNWDTSEVTIMSNMFFNAQNFNQDISNWNTSKVTEMSAMFYGAQNFNQNISNWDTCKVTNMAAMFYDAQNFNQDISNWDISKVTYMVHMFLFAHNFNQDMCAWGSKLQNSALIEGIFTSTSCPSTNDPDMSKPTPGPFCHECILTSSSSTTTPSSAPSITPTTAPSTSVIGVSGDPHFKTWAGEGFDFHGVCDLVLLSVPTFRNYLGLDIHIRTKKTRNWSYVSSASVRIGIDYLEIEGGRENKLRMNGKHQSLVPASISGFPITFHQDSKKRSFVIHLSARAQVQIKTWHAYVSVSIDPATSKEFNTSVGMMGTFPDGIKLARDNTTEMTNNNAFGQEWQVLSTEHNLFHATEGPQAPKKCEIPSVAQLRRRLSKSDIAKIDAELACARVDESNFDLCVFDVLATNDKDVVYAY